jgi:hypothetical protein
MEESNGPQFNAVLLLLYRTQGTIPGAPSDLPYTAYKPTYPSGAPPINMALLPPGSILDKLRGNKTIPGPIITYLQEGRW